MAEFGLRLADKNIAVTSVYESSAEYCQEYLADFDTPDLSVCVSESDIVAERDYDDATRAAEGLLPRTPNFHYLETLALYRKIAEALVEYDTLLFHGSAVAVDGEVYLFTAKSGVGKSTHTRLWRECFGERAVMVNDDKPLIKITDSGVLVYGTPWNGKHRLSTNIRLPMRALCILERAEDNRIEKVDSRENFHKILAQTYRPNGALATANTLRLIDKLLQSVPLYRLGCNMELSAAEVAYNGMRGYGKMKLKSDFITHTSGAEQLMISAGGSFGGMIRSNTTAAAIIDLVKNEISRDGIVDAMLAKYDAPREIIERDVDRVIATLREIGALDE